MTVTSHIGYRNTAAPLAPKKVPDTFPRQERLDRRILSSEDRLRRLLASTFHYYHHWRTHLSLAIDRPDTRPAQPPEQGTVVSFSDLSGLHHRYERVTAWSSGAGASQGRRSMNIREAQPMPRRLISCRCPACRLRVLAAGRPPARHAPSTGEPALPGRPSTPPGCRRTPPAP